MKAGPEMLKKLKSILGKRTIEDRENHAPSCRDSQEFIFNTHDFLVSDSSHSKRQKTGESLTANRAFPQLSNSPHMTSLDLPEFTGIHV